MGLSCAQAQATASATAYNSERDHPLEIKPKFEILAPNHDFTKYNRRRNDDWDYPRSSLIFMRELGEGEFGKVFLMIAEGIAGYPEKIPVAVKTLSSLESNFLSRFYKEAELMKQFIHPNIISLLGTTLGPCCSRESCAPLIIIEYMPYGDLRGLLQTHRPGKYGGSPITQKHLYKFATDVAKALEFLSSRKYVHRDIAARNCLVGTGLRVKIADFGLARGMQGKDYYKVAGSAVLPVRWMAPECLLYGIFTTASDVWSYGVLLWEIQTYGRTPLEDMEQAQEIIEAAENGSLHHSRPDACPDDICDLMRRCHHHRPQKRIMFSEILSRLEIGKQY